ncbi:MAG TPA: Maf family protein [Candidatus Kapabacteria bacterium]|nr:Maf family protein [Candidatus Kapabacteria bacterium]
MKFRNPIILASASPRRIQLLRQIGIECDVHPSNIDEETDHKNPAALVEDLALRKAREVGSRFPKGIVIGADTIVVLDGNVLGKPKDAGDAKRMLRTLSGRTHTVYTGFCILDVETNKNVCDHEATEVTFRELDDKEIADYVASGSPMDKAGSYGIQDDFGAVFVTRIAGDYYTVVGLPLAKLYTRLKEFAQ